MIHVGYKLSTKCSSGGHVKSNWTKPNEGVQCAKDKCLTQLVFPSKKVADATLTRVLIRIGGKKEFFSRSDSSYQAIVSSSSVCLRNKEICYGSRFKIDERHVETC